MRFRRFALLLLPLLLTALHLSAAGSASEEDVAGSGDVGISLGDAPPASGDPAPAAEEDSAEAEAPAAGSGAIPGAGDPATRAFARIPSVGVLPATARYRFEPAPGEFRGAWLHWEDYRSPQAVARTVARSKKAGLNALLAMANYPYQANWRSNIIPTNPHVAAGFDPMRELVRQAHAAGIEVHPYLVMLNGGLTKHPNIQPDWYAVDRAGRRTGGWLSPTHPEVRAFLKALVTELAQTGVDGIHYDYIRHEYDSDYDYGEHARRMFFERYGVDPLHLDRARSGGGMGMRLLRTDWHRGAGRSYFSALESFVRQTGYAPPVVDEDNLRRLSTDNVVVATHLHSGRVKGETLNALMTFVANGGACLVLDGPEVNVISRKLADAVGLQGKSFFGDKPLSLSLFDAAHPIAAGLPSNLQITARGNACPELNGAHLVAQMADGTPAVTVKPYGRGQFVAINFNCFEGAAATHPAVQRLFANAVDWLAEQQGITNTTKLGAGVVNAPAEWDRWRIEQVTELVAEMTRAARAVRPDIVVSAAGGTQAEDLTRVRRDGLSWLQTGTVNFVCPMAYTSDNNLFRRRLSRELERVPDARIRGLIFAGIGVYKMEDNPQRVVEQVNIARENGLKGVCFFAFEHLNDRVISALGNGPFRNDVEVPFRMVPVSEAALR